MMAREGRSSVRRQAGVRFLTAIAAAVLVFAAAHAAKLKWDISEDGLYTLSASTRLVLSQLEEPILIRAYVTPGLPQPYGRLRRFLEDMLRSYHDAGRGQVGFEIVNPEADANVAAALAAMRIPKVQVQAIESDRAEIKQGYLAVVVEHLDKKETIPIVRSEAGFEYLLTRKIKKITGKSRARIGIVVGAGARPLQRLRTLQQMVIDDYELVEIKPDIGPIGPDIRALIVTGFEQQPSNGLRYALDQFRMSGRGMLVLAGNVEPQLQAGFKARAVKQEVNAWLKDLGIVVEPGLVMDPRARRIILNQRQGGMVFRTAVDYPFMPQATRLSNKHIVTHGLEAVVMPFASPLAWHSDKTGEVLVRSSAKAAVQSGPPFDVNPLVPLRQRFAGISAGQVNLALLTTGPAKSVFDAAPKQKPASMRQHIARAEHTRVLVVGSRALLDGMFIDEINSLFILNALDWVAADEALISLRSRGATERPLMNLVPAARTAWKGIWMFGAPVVVVILGLWRWRRLKRYSLLMDNT